MNSNYFTRCSSVNYSVAAGGGGGGMEAAVTGRRRTTTHAEEEEAEEEEEEDGEEEEEEDALVTANPAAISHPAIAPFRYLINEQAKSFVVLQELQNEVGALLEFRDLVMETFPHLRQKTGGPRVGGGQGGGKHWEPGVRVKRKLHQLHSRSDQTQHDSHDLAAPRSRSNSHGKGGGSAVKSSSGINEAAANSGTSSAGSSAVQDSGFCADSSKEHCSTSAAPRGKEAEADDELWNLLDMIHVKGTRLRLQVEHLQHKLDERERVSASPSPGFRRRSRSLEYVSSKTTAAAAEHHLHQQAELRLSVESEMRALKQERDELLERLADMEAEKRRQLQLRASTATVDHLKQEDGFRIDRLQAEKRQLRAPTPTVDHLRQEDGFRIQATADHLKQEDGFRIHRRPDFLTTPPRLHRPHVRLGTLDGIVSSPSPRIKGARGVTLDKNKTAAILAEFNPHELQRHLLFTTFQYQIANSRIERISRSYVDIHHQVEKFKEENDDLRFQLEEKSIELEGTRARIRLLERLQSAKFAATESSVVVGGGETLSNTPTPNLMLAQVNTAGDCEPNAHHSSSTESAHEDAARLESPKKRPPSKIPLKSYTAPKPPVARPPQSLGAGNRSKSREARTASPCHTQTTGRESLRRPRKTSSSTPTSFSSTGSSHSTPRSLKKPSSSSSSSRVPPPAAVADQGEHKKTTTSAVVKEPERLEKTEEFVDSLDNGQQESSNCNNCTFLGNQELDRSMSSVAQSRGWLVNSPRPRHFFDSLSGDREAMAESDSLEPSCSDLV